MVLELGFEPFDLAGALAQLGIGRSFPDAGQGPAHRVGAAGGDTRADQRIEGFQVRQPSRAITGVSSPPSTARSTVPLDPFTEEGGRLCRVRPGDLGRFVMAI